MEQENGQQPLARIKAGGVSVSLWENKAIFNDRQVTILKASLQRTYKAKDGQWKTSNSFSRNEIPLAIFCLRKAFEKIIDIQNQQSKTDSPVIAEEHVGY